MNTPKPSTIDQIRTELDARAAELDSARLCLATYVKACHQTLDARDEARRLLAEVEKENAGTAAERDALQSKLVEAEKMNSDLVAEIKRLQHVLSFLGAELTHAQVRLADQARDVDEAQCLLTERLKESDRLMMAGLASDQRCDELQKRIDATKNALNIARSGIEIAPSFLAELFKILNGA